MKVALCTRNPGNPVIRLLERALVERGHRAQVIGDPRELDGGYDVAYWRPDSRDAQVAAFARQAALVLDGLGTPFLNGLASMERSSSAFVSHALFAARGLPVPETRLAPRPDDSWDAVPDAPAIVKPVWGKAARGVVLCAGRDAARAHVERVGAPCVIQQPVPWRCQYRCVVTAERAVRVYRQENPAAATAAIERFDRFDAHPVADPDPELRTLAASMLSAVGGDLMRADVLEDAEGRRWALEINASFGFPHDDGAVIDAFVAELGRIALFT
jgi:glutathione synthase/RimK-type ligase-like ATP-grasp enzyme